MNKNIIILTSITLILLVIAIFGIIISYSINSSSDRSNVDKLIEECKNEEDSSKINKCIRSLAKEKQDAQLCEFIDDPESKSGCYHGFATYMLNSSACYNVVDVQARDECFRYVAELTLDGEACKGISDYVVPEYNTGVNNRDYCYIEIAIRTNDSSWCDYLITPDTNIFWHKEKCKARFT